MIVRGSRILASHLKEATIKDIKFLETPLSEALQVIHSELSQIEPYFKTCEFRLDVDYPEAPITLTLSDIRADKSLKYIAELSLNRCYFRPNKLIIAHMHSDQRGLMEKLAGSFIVWFTIQWDKIQVLFD